MGIKPVWDQDQYNRAWWFAAEAHGREDQRYPGNDFPYIFHIGTVAMETTAALAAESFPNPDLAVQCALLHDVIEDTAITYHDVKSEFGTAVADGVLALTKNDQLPSKQAQMGDSLQRIQQQPHEVWLVKLADRSANLGKPPHYWSLEKTDTYRLEAQQIYNALHPASPFLAQRLKQRITAYQAYCSPSS